MKQVTRQEFWAFIKEAKFNIVSSIVTAYPYTSVFKTDHGAVVGKIVDRYRDTERKWPVVSEFFLVETR
jgi:hypothetical protein